MERYTDKELIPFFELVAKGYCYKQSCDLIGYSRDRMVHTMNDEDVRYHILCLSSGARLKIEEGKIPVPARYDGLYDEYK
jgi:hypothetical protein